MNVNQYVSNKIREFRLEKGSNRVDIADYLNMSLSAYGKLELGKTAIDGRRIYYLSQYFDKSFQEFFPSDKISEEELKGENSDSVRLGSLLKEKRELITHLKSEILFLRKQLENK